MARDLVELVGFPNEDPDFFSKKRKILQLYVDEKPILLFERKGVDLHKSILKKFLESHSIIYEEKQAPNLEEILPVPALQGANYKVVGAGVILVDVAAKLYSGLTGDSYTYKMRPEFRHAILVRETFRSMGYEIL